MQVCNRLHLHEAAESADEGHDDCWSLCCHVPVGPLLLLMMNVYPVCKALAVMWMYALSVCTHSSCGILLNKKGLRSQFNKERFDQIGCRYSVP